MVAMRRKDRQVSDEEAMAYLKAAEYGVLSTVGAGRRTLRCAFDVRG